MEKNHILFLDNISRSILATVVEDTPERLIVKNPVVMQIVTDQSNKMRVQLVPLLLRDLHKNPEEDVQWSYNPSTITRSEMSGLNDKFIAQYEFVVRLTPEKAAKLSSERKPSGPPIAKVKLFEDGQVEQVKDGEKGADA